jgi:hypothetical protein
MKVLFITTGADSKTKSGWEDLVYSYEDLGA